MTYTVYILQSESNGRLYIGQTANLERRLHEHRRGQSRSTGGRGPWTLIYTCPSPTRADAVRHERWLESLKNPTYVLDYVQSR